MVKKKKKIEPQKERSMDPKRRGACVLKTGSATREFIEQAPEGVTTQYILKGRSIGTKSLLPQEYWFAVSRKTRSEKS